MASSRSRTPLLLFGLIALYIVMQSIWWGWLLLRRSAELERLQDQVVNLGAEPTVPMRHSSQVFWMIVGEGAVFVILLLVALWLTYRTLRYELRLARQQRGFLLATSHELRTPIAGLKLHLQTLRRKGLDDAQRATLATAAVDDLDRLGALTEKILLATRLDEAGPILDASAFDARQEVADLCLRASIGYGRAHRIVAEVGAPVRLYTDLTAFRSVISNLIENACKYAPTGTSVEVDFSSDLNGTTITVRDHGPGVPPADRERIFDRFFRGGNEETRGTKGTGLGLFIVQRLMRDMGGRVEYRSAPDGGAIFAAIFPL